MKTNIINSSGVMVWTDHDHKEKCFICHNETYVVSTESAFPEVISVDQQRQDMSPGIQLPGDDDEQPSTDDEVPF